ERTPARRRGRVRGGARARPTCGRAGRESRRASARAILDRLDPRARHPRPQRGADAGPARHDHDHARGARRSRVTIVPPEIDRRATPSTAGHRDARTKMDTPVDTTRYARCIENSKRIRWDIDRDVLRGRSFELDKKFLPDRLSKADTLEFLDPSERRLLSQVQGRTYANIFGLVERFIAAKVLEISREHWLGDQVALEALVRFTDEELKHQELFRRIDEMLGEIMPPGYSFDPDPNQVAAAVLDKSTWAV